MNRSERISNPNRSPRTVLAVGFLGLAALVGCSDKDTATEPTKTSAPERTEQVYTKDNNCDVAGTVSISSNTEKTVEEFVDEYLDYLGEQTDEDLSRCKDEMLDEIREKRSNIESGAVSPSSETHSVVMPRVAQLK